jgi:hypothetical protein
MQLLHAGRSLHGLHRRLPLGRAFGNHMVEHVLQRVIVVIIVVIIVTSTLGAIQEARLVVIHHHWLRIIGNGRRGVSSSCTTKRKASSTAIAGTASLRRAGRGGAATRHTSGSNGFGTDTATPRASPRLDSMRATQLDVVVVGVLIAVVHHSLLLWECCVFGCGFAWSGVGPMRLRLGPTRVVGEQ